MAIGDLYQLVHSYPVKGEIFQNHYTYYGAEGSPSAIGLATQWRADILPVVCNLLTTDVLNHTLKVINLFSVTDFYTLTAVQAGNAGTTYATAKHAINFTLYPNRRDIKPGSKRYSPLSATNWEDGVATQAGFLTSVEAMRTALLEDVTTGGGTPTVYNHVVVKRIAYTVPDSSPPRTAWRLPANAEEADYGLMLTVAVNLQASTQDSRGNGR